MSCTLLVWRLSFMKAVKPRNSSFSNPGSSRLATLWRTTAFGILSCSVSYFKNAVINMNIPNPIYIPNYISSSDIIRAL
jgi:hypothetical protein